MKRLELTPSRNFNYRKGQVQSGDRYVGVRNEEQFDLANHLLTSQKENTPSKSSDSPATIRERDAKLKAMRVNNGKDDGIGGDRVCAFRKGLAPIAALGHKQQPNVLYSCMKPSSSVKRSRRYIAKSPERILDAPGIRDDFYAHLTDWSASNVVAVALGQIIYLWNADKGEAEMLTEFSQTEAHPTLVKWSLEGKFLSIGFSDGSVKIFDAVRKVCLRTISVQMHRTACAGWMRQGILTYGTRSGRIYHHDVRVQQSLIGTFDSHSHEVCGLKWSDDERYLTSGGADAAVNVWERNQINAEEPNSIWTFSDHTAAVKAIEYVPFLGIAGSNMVATGGGTNDHTVRIWNLSTGAAYSSFDTFSQVTGILFNKTYKEMVTGHGNPNSGVRVWRYNSSKGFEHVADLKSHGGRVLGLCQNPNGEYVMSSGEDETMRLWHCWKIDESLKNADGVQSTSGRSKSLTRSDLKPITFQLR
ncbi:cell division cycle protein 20 like protein [Ditylenchus destructor]|uniref:Cell division cycle protein 20 like protein n=1 Tax=Ditylenchus destructor TaxID=166010 RepID=A0AAD4NIS4_9BILA|nr:cell division cycle protein 20 like protein [Ditylenchus destructor]